MCLVVPLKVIKKQKDFWLMEDGRRVRSLVKKVKAGDYLICQQDLAIEKVPVSKAQLIRNALQQGI
ncbi:MAG: HypC/HybG/HupF family hydrogenase formation chaperone [Candidatus Beckwithbacteria bacterium]